MGRLLLLISIIAWPALLNAKIYDVTNGVVRFHSDAPHELIRAQSSKLRGALDPDKKAFAFKIEMVTFQGFNSPLQREHFNENYMESTKYPDAIFKGKIIEDMDLTKDGEYEVRAKGKLIIHGIEQERIIKAHVSTQKGTMTIASDFIVTLADYNIKIPRVVYDKLAPEIKVSVNASLEPRP